MDKKQDMNTTQFNTWLSTHVQPGLLSEIIRSYPEIEKYGIKAKILQKPLFDTVDLLILSKLSERVEEDYLFRLLHIKRIKTIGLALTLYVAYVKETTAKKYSLVQNNPSDNQEKEESLLDNDDSVKKDKTEDPFDENNEVPMNSGEESKKHRIERSKIPLRDAIVSVLRETILLAAEEIADSISQKGLYSLSDVNKVRIVESTINISCRRNRYVKPENCIFDYIEESNGIKEYFLIENKERIENEATAHHALNTNTSDIIVQNEKVDEKTQSQEILGNTIIDISEQRLLTTSEDEEKSRCPENPKESDSLVEEEVVLTVQDGSEFGLDQYEESQVKTISAPLKETGVLESADSFISEGSIGEGRKPEKYNEPSLRDAIIEVMKSDEVSMTVFQIFRKILDSNLYVFSYKNPITIISDNINRACRDTDYPHKEHTILFGARYNISGLLEFYLLSRESELDSQIENEVKAEVIDQHEERQKTLASFEDSEEYESNPLTIMSKNPSSQKKRTICDAIVEVLKEHDVSLTAPQIYDRIIDLKLYTFRAKQPINVVYAELNKACLDVNYPQNTAGKLFGSIKIKGKKKEYFLLSRKSELGTNSPEMNKSSDERTERMGDFAKTTKTKHKTDKAVSELDVVSTEESGVISGGDLERSNNLLNQEVVSLDTDNAIVENLVSKPPISACVPSAIETTTKDSSEERSTSEEIIDSGESNYYMDTNNKAQEYSFTVRTDMTYTSPVSLTYFRKTFSDLNTWADLYLKILSLLFKEHWDLFPINQSIQLSGRGVFLIAAESTAKGLRSPKQVPGTDLFVETNMSVRDILTKIRLLLDFCQISYNDVVIKYIQKTSKDSVADVKPVTEPKKAQGDFEDTFRDWLKRSNNLSESTCNGYVSAVKSAEKFAKRLDCSSQPLLSYSYSAVKTTVDELLSSNDFMKLNQKLHNLYGVALSYLLRYVECHRDDTEAYKHHNNRLEKNIKESIAESSNNNDKADTRIKQMRNPYAKKRAKTPEEKLYKRIYREINRVKYIGDIAIDDAEYDILVQYIKKLLSNFANVRIKKEDPILATTLVQIGIKEYNGRYWPHVSRISGVKLDGFKQGEIGRLFYDTLYLHEKLHLGEKDYVNNILMHCFVTKHYAADFFEFLFAYYNYDLDRDLSQHTKEMRDYLLASMKKAEDSSRAFRIKKGTSDAATANERGCKIRVRNILKWIDAYMFEDVLPDKSPNRTAQFFCEWAKKSKRFRVEKNSISGRGRNGKILFRSPYLHFDLKKEQFCVVMPVQTVPLSDEEENVSLSWKIKYNEKESIISSDTESTVIGCKNRDKEYFFIESKDIFSEFRIELIKNDIVTIRTFLIKADSARFFDDEFDYFARNRLYEGKVYAFTRRGEPLDSDAEFTTEPYLKLDFYTFDLVRGNVVKKPDGDALFVGKDMKDGLLEHNLLSGMYVLDNESRLEVYNKAPGLLIKTTKSSLNGILLVINQEKYRLDADDHLVFNSETSTDIYCLIRMERYCVHNGSYHVLIDVPSERRTRSYDFALIAGLSYQFSSPLYIYQPEGYLSLLGVDQIEPSSKITLTEKGYHFNVIETGTTLNLLINRIPVQIDIPIFQWRFSSNEPWHMEKPESLWHKELPDVILIKAPSNGISICSDQVQLDEDTQSIQLNYKRDEDVYICDTRKIKSWLDTGPALHHILVKLDNTSYSFLSVVSRCILTSCILKEDRKNKQLIIKSNILGFNDCVADIICNGVIIADKIELTSNGVKYPTDKLYGDFEIVFYEYDDDEDFDFGEAVYSEFARKKILIKNRYDLLDKKIRVDYITEDKKADSFFGVSRYDIRDWFIIRILKQDEDDHKIYYGESQSTNPSLSQLEIQVELLDENDISKALIFFYDEEEETFVDFIYDTNQKRLFTSESTNPVSKGSNQYLEMSIDNYYHISLVK